MAPPHQGLPLSDQRQPDLLQLLGETKHSQGPEEQLEKDSWGVNIYTTWCVGRGESREVVGSEGTDR